MKQHGSLVKIDRWWPIGFRWQWRGAATNHIRFPLVAHWRIEAGGAFPNVRFYRQVVRIWRLCIVFGPDRLHDLAERVADLEGRLATATDTIAYMVEENNHTTRAFGDRAAAEHQRAEQLAERVAALESELAEERRWHQEFRRQYLAARDVVEARNERVAALERVEQAAWVYLAGHHPWCSNDPDDPPPCDCGYFLLSHRVRDAIAALDAAREEAGDA